MGNDAAGRERRRVASIELKIRLYYPKLRLCVPQSIPTSDQALACLAEASQRRKRTVARCARRRMLVFRSCTYRSLYRRTCLSLLGVIVGIHAPGTSAQSSLPIENPIIFVKQTPVEYMFSTITDIFGNFLGYWPPEAQPIGGNLFRLDPDGSVVNLTNQDLAAVRDPEISFDGTKVIFSMKVLAWGVWQIYEMNVDGSGLRRISQDLAYNDLDPAYLPDGRIVFTSDRNRWSDGYENLPSAQLCVMDADGTDIQVIRQHMAGQFNPQVGSNGKLYFTQWDFHDRRESVVESTGDLDVNRFLLWESFVDGSGVDHPLFGAHTLWDFTGGYTEVRELPNEPGKFIGVLANESYTYGAGSIVRIEPQENADLEERIFITADVFEVYEDNLAGRWRGPYPLSDGAIVASYAEGPVHTVYTDNPGTDIGDTLPRWKLVKMNADGGNQQTLYEDPEFWLWQPVEVIARPAPVLQSGKMKVQFPYGIINSLDVSLRGINGGSVIRGDFQPAVSLDQVSSVRVLRENVRTLNRYQSNFPNYDDPDVEVIGTAPVYPDGSFAAVVPADTPLVWELLDGQGNVLVRERFGTELRPGEFRQCAGCHTPHDGSRGNETNLALNSPTNLSGQEVDLDADGVVDLLEALLGSRVRHDFDGDRRADILWRKSSVGSTWFHLMEGSTVKQEGAGDAASMEWTIAGVGDFDGDSKSDLLWRRANGANWFHMMDGMAVASEGPGQFVPTDWQVAGIGDFDGNGRDDVFWRKINGATWFHLMDGTSIAGEGAGNTVSLDWSLAGVGDFNGDGRDDLFWRRENGANWIYFMNGTAVGSEGPLSFVPTDWSVAGVGDFDGDDKADILWRRDATGATWLYLMDGTSIKDQGPGNTVAPEWQVAAVRDFDGNGQDDIMWRKANGASWFYFMDGTSIASEGPGNFVAPVWQVVDP
jgi:hypothetical protein